MTIGYHVENKIFIAHWKQLWSVNDCWSIETGDVKTTVHLPYRMVHSLRPVLCSSQRDFKQRRCKQGKYLEKFILNEEVEETNIRTLLVEIALPFYMSLSSRESLSDKDGLCNCISKNIEQTDDAMASRRIEHLSIHLLGITSQNAVSGIEHVLNTALSIFEKLVTTSWKTEKRIPRQRYEKKSASLSILLDFTLRLCDMIDSSKPSHLRTSPDSLQSGHNGAKETSHMEKVLTSVFQLKWNNALLPALMEGIIEHRFNVPLAIWNQLRVMLEKMLLNNDVFDNDVMPMKAVVDLLRGIMLILMVTKDIRWATYIRALLQQCPIKFASEMDRCIQTSMQHHYGILSYFHNAVQLSLNDTLQMEKANVCMDSWKPLNIPTGWKDILLLLHVLHASSPILYTGCMILPRKQESHEYDSVAQTLARLLHHELKSAKPKELDSSSSINEKMNLSAHYNSVIHNILSFGNQKNGAVNWKAIILTRLSLRWLFGCILPTGNEKDTLHRDDQATIATQIIVTLFDKATDIRLDLFNCILEGILQECRSSCPDPGTRKMKAGLPYSSRNSTDSQLATAFKMIIERSKSNQKSMDALLSQIPAIQSWLTQLFDINITLAQFYFTSLLSPTSISTDYYEFVQIFLQELLRSNNSCRQESAITIYCLWIQEQLMLPAQSRQRLSHQCFQDLIEQLRKSVNQLESARCICFVHILATMDEYSTMTRIRNKDSEAFSEASDNEGTCKDENGWMFSALYDFVCEYLCKFIKMTSFPWIRTSNNDTNLFKATDESVCTNLTTKCSTFDHCASIAHDLTFTEVDDIFCHADDMKQIDNVLSMSSAIRLGQTFYALLKCTSTVENMGPKYPKKIAEHPYGRFAESITPAILKFVCTFDQCSMWITSGSQVILIDEDTDEDMPEKTTASVSSHTLESQLTSPRVSPLHPSSDQSRAVWKCIARAYLALGLCHITIERIISYLKINSDATSKWDEKLWQLLDFMCSVERMLSAFHAETEPAMPKCGEDNKYATNPFHESMAHRLPQLIRLLVHALGLDFPFYNENVRDQDPCVDSPQHAKIFSNREASKSLVSSDGFAYVLSYCCKEFGDRASYSSIFQSLMYLYGGIAKMFRMQDEKAIAIDSTNCRPQQTSLKPIILSVNPQTITSYFPAWLSQFLKKNSSASTVLDSLKSYDPYVCKILTGLSTQLSRLSSHEVDTISGNVRGQNDPFFSTLPSEGITVQNITSYLALRYFLDLAYFVSSEGMEKSQMACAKLLQYLLQFSRESRRDEADNTVHLRLACMAYDLICVHVLYQPSVLLILLDICLPTIILSASNKSSSMITQSEISTFIKENHNRIVGFTLACGIENCKKVRHRKEHNQQKAVGEQSCGLKRKLKRLQHSILESSDEESSEYQGNSPSSVNDCGFDDERARLPHLISGAEKMMALQSILKYTDQMQSVLIGLLDTTSTKIWQQSSRNVTVLMKDLVALMTGSRIEAENLDLVSANYSWIVQLFIQSTERPGYGLTKANRGMSADLNRSISKLLVTLDGTMRIIKKGFGFIMVAAQDEDGRTKSIPFLSITTHYIIAAKRWLHEMKLLCDISDRILQTKLANTGLRFDIFSSEWSGLLARWREISKSDAELQSYLQQLLDQLQPYGLPFSNIEEHEILNKPSRNRKHWLGTIPILRRSRRKRLRSRHPYIDECLREESGDDAFVDLEDFIV